MKKHLNIFIFLLFSTIFLLFSSQIKFSTNFLELFFSQKSITLFNVISKLGLSNNIIISKKGFTDTCLDELYIISKKLKQMPEISKVTISLLPPKKLKDYYKKNYYIMADFNSSKFTNKDIFNKLKANYENIQDSFIYLPVDTNDPLELFKIKLYSHSKYLKIKDYGYALKATTNINTSSAEEAESLYNKIDSLLSSHKDTISYAPFFFLVENSSHIRSDTQKIITIATILLLLLYFFILKNYKLLIHTIIAIGSSVLGAILASSFFFNSINIMILAFGISITTISIDYMFHYYFHGNFTTKSFIKQKKVFFGFITSFGVFVIFCFIEIKLFYQLAFFSSVSLFIAYILFSWVFSYLDITKPILKQQSSNTKSFNPYYVVIISLILLAYSYEHLKFDNNLRNLDYKNEKLLELSKLFNESLIQNKYQNIIISAKSKELLLEKYEKLQKLYPDILGIGKFILSKKECERKVQKLKKYNFKTLKERINKESQKVGFGDTFTNSYANIRDLKCDMKPFDEMGFKIINHLNTYYTLTLVPKKYKLLFEDGVEPLDITKALSEDMQKAKKSIAKFILISLLFIFIILFIISGLDILYPLSFILFPLSVVLFFISLFGTINIMHLFALIVLLAISIDYGVYMYKSKTLLETKMAIRYALLSTLAGFGVLILSDTVALYSIGFVISIGIMAIFILIYGKNYENI